MNKRKIKFRVWHTDEKVMEYPGKPFKKDSDSWDGVWGTVLEVISSYLNRPERVFLQYTGLEDKNGKEIYEGDVVQAVYEWETYDGDAYCEKSTIHKGEVVFSGGGWCVKNQIQGLYNWDQKTLEVIGNIYENPEMLLPKTDANT